MGYGVMVTLQILVLSFLVRIRVSQLRALFFSKGAFFCLCAQDELPMIGGTCQISKKCHFLRFSRYFRGEVCRCSLTYLPKKEVFEKPRMPEISFIDLFVERK